ncbi:vegetative cell wall protein gp1-like [Triticum dicoccoides]|uniref:vegetative cell wall protein gp1-like n=1 Tax=Triticum dicoccoides TaxID=85692 RepID=UPI00189030C4|nr:vegetative cell wall protein gp1-like [Triticum dicoccoides]
MAPSLSTFFFLSSSRCSSLTIRLVSCLCHSEPVPWPPGTFFCLDSAPSSTPDEACTAARLHTRQRRHRWLLLPLQRPSPTFDRATPAPAPADRLPDHAADQVLASNAWIRSPSSHAPPRRTPLPPTKSSPRPVPSPETTGKAPRQVLMRPLPCFPARTAAACFALTTSPPSFDPTSANLVPSSSFRRCHSSCLPFLGIPSRSKNPPTLVFPSEPTTTDPPDQPLVPVRRPPRARSGRPQLPCAIPCLLDLPSWPVSGFSFAPSREPVPWPPGTFFCLGSAPSSTPDEACTVARLHTRQRRHRWLLLPLQRPSPTFDRATLAPAPADRLPDHAADQVLASNAWIRSPSSHAPPRRTPLPPTKSSPRPVPSPETTGKAPRQVLMRLLPCFPARTVAACFALTTSPPSFDPTSANVARDAQDPALPCFDRPVRPSTALGLPGLLFHRLG